MSNSPTKQCTKCKEIKELSEFHKNKATKDGLSCWCKICGNKSTSAYKKSHPEKVKADRATYCLKHSEEIKKWHFNHYWENIETEKDRKAVYYLENAEKIKARNAAWAKANPSKNSAKRARRRAVKLQATPKWLTKEHWEQIDSFYIEAARLTKETGIRHQVDHILPLQGEGITGLHAPWNLQILTISENSKKHNSFDFTYDNLSWSLT